MQQEVGASEAGGKPEVCGIMETNGGRARQEKEKRSPVSNTPHRRRVL